MLLLGIRACNATNNDTDCCTLSNNCGVGEGDCDTDSECDAGLLCGSDNCKSFDSSWFYSDFDCCVPNPWG